MRQAEPEPAARWASRPPVELLEEPLLLARPASPGPRSATSSATASPAAPRRAPRSACRRRVLGGVLEQVDQHLLEQHASSGHQRQVGGQVDVHRRARPARPRRCASAAATTSSSGCHSLLRAASAPALQPRHVEQVRHQARQPLGLVADRVQQLAPARAGRAAPAAVQQRCGRAGDPAERRAQVVRDRAEQRAAQCARSRPRRAPARPRSASSGPLERQRDLARRRLEQLPLLRARAACGPLGERSASTPSRRPGALAAAGRARAAPGSVSVPRPAGWPCSSTQRATACSLGVLAPAARAPPAERRAPPLPGRPEHAAHLAPRTRATCSATRAPQPRSASRGQRPARGSARTAPPCAARAARAALGLAPHAAPSAR